MDMSIWVAIAGWLASGLLGALISIIVYGKREKRHFKMDTLKRFAANRYDLRGEEFSRALNEIFVVFNENTQVMRALSAFHERIMARQLGGGTDDLLISLYKAMCKDVGVDYEHFNDSFFMTPFNTKQSSQVPRGAWSD